jgi:phospholipid-transporting ATPase
MPKTIPLEVDKYLNKLKKYNLQIFYEPPNENLYDFQGSFKMFVNRKLGLEGPKTALEEKNVLLRGSILRNTDYVFGVVIYTGHDTKIMKNSVTARVKWSKLESQLNLYLQITFFFLLVFCTIGSTLNIVWIKRNEEKTLYMDLPSKLTINFFTRLGNWLLMFANVIPISLMVSLESVKFMQAKIIANDPKMITKETGIKCEVQSSNLNEELGQIDFIFSDKTGTLTCNQMNFKKLVIGNKGYGFYEEPEEMHLFGKMGLFCEKL